MNIQNKNGELVPFESEKIYNTVIELMKQTDLGVDMLMSMDIPMEIYRKCKDNPNIVPTTDMVKNDIVELLVEKGRDDVVEIIK